MVMQDVGLTVVPRIKRVVPISPVSDLRPLQETELNAGLRIEDAEARSESPALGSPIPGIPVSVWVGAEERPAFLDQARWQADAWQVLCRHAPGRHHFDIIDDLLDPNSPIVSDILA